MINELLIKYAIRLTWKKDIDNIRGKLKQADIKLLSSGQKNDIIAYYQNLAGKKVPIYWHEYFYSRNDYYSVKYIPTCLYHSDVIYKLNSHKLRHAYVDKGIYDIYFPDVTIQNRLVGKKQ